MLHRVPVSDAARCFGISFRGSLVLWTEKSRSYVAFNPSEVVCCNAATGVDLELGLARFPNCFSKRFSVVK